MREPIDADSARNDPHGPSELSEPAAADHGKPGVQTAWATTPKGAGGGGDEPLIEYSTGPSAETALPAGANLGKALKAVKAARGAFGDAKLYGTPR